MIVVLDASAALGILLKKEQSETYTDMLKEARTVMAPELYLSELSNAAWKHHKLPGFSDAQAMALAEDGIALVDQYVPANELWQEALRVSMMHDHPVYDAMYVICARRHGGVLLTYDQRLRQLCRRAGVEVL